MKWKNDGKTWNLFSKLIYWPKKYVSISFPQHLLRIRYIRYKCVSAISATGALSNIRFGECLLFYPSCLLYGKDFFQTFRSMANKRSKWYATKSVYVAITVFFFWKKKREQEIIRLRMWTCIFRVKWYTVGKHNAMAQSALKKIPQETFHLERKTLHCYNESFGSKYVV